MAHLSCPLKEDYGKILRADEEDSERKVKTLFRCDPGAAGSPPARHGALNFKAV